MQMRTVNVQLVRAFDVLAFGPLLIYAGTRPSDLPAWLRTTLMLLGGTTIGYNAMGYMRHRRRGSL